VLTREQIIQGQHLQAATLLLAYRQIGLKLVVLSAAIRGMKASPIILLLIAGTAFAGSATWNLNPISGDWNNAANWTPRPYLTAPGIPRRSQFPM